MADVEPSPGPFRTGYAIRASLACVPCRDRHRKCDAERPCSQCQVDDLECFYKKSRRGKFDQASLGQDMEQNISKKGPTQRDQRDLGDTNLDRIPELSAGSSVVSHTASESILQLLTKPSSAHHSQTSRKQDKVALTVMHSDIDVQPSQSSNTFSWLSHSDVLPTNDTGMPNYDPQAGFEGTAADQFGESSSLESLETWQVTPSSGTAGTSSFNTAHPIGSMSWRRGGGPVRVNDIDPQRSSVHNMNLDQIQSTFRGGAIPFALNQIPLESQPRRVDLLSTDSGTSALPVIVYGYGSWTATARHGSVESISLGQDLQEARDGQKQTHIPTYRDEAFPSVGYFYRPSTSQESADWLLPLLQRSAPLYHACVSLGLCHQLLGSENTRECQLDFSNELRKHHALSLKGLQERINSFPTPLDPGFVTTALDLLACIWQLLSIECWRTTEGYWEMHLTALGTIFSIMQPGVADGHLFLQTSSDSPQCTSFRKSSRIDDALRRYPMSPDAVVLKYYLQCYVWADILSCATFGLKRPFANPFQYLRLLKDGKLDLCGLMGCHNEVMTIIMRIAIFKDWKETTQSNGRLSLRLLIEQSDNLERDLHYELLKLLEERSYLTRQPEVDWNYVTEIYIRSALIYLHTVISGPSVHIPEICENVEQVLKALLILPSRLVLRISWPFCIAACMAVDEQQDKFRKIASNAIQAGFLVGTVVKGLQVAEECWRIRRSSPLSPAGLEWTAAMKSLGLRILLI